MVLKVPDIFCCSFIILMSLSAWLFSNGTPKSLRNLKIGSLCSINLSSKFLALVFGFLPRFPCFSGFREGGFSSIPLMMMALNLYSNALICSKSRSLTCSLHSSVYFFISVNNSFISLAHCCL